jgi:hypothetical protein
VDGALVFDKAGRWQSAPVMFETLRAAYDELLRNPAVSRGPFHQARSASPTRGDDLSSILVDVAFGEEHTEAIARERKRTQEVIEGMPSISVAVESIRQR